MFDEPPPARWVFQSFRILFPVGHPVAGTSRLCVTHGTSRRASLGCCKAVHEGRVPEISTATRDVMQIEVNTTVNRDNTVPIAIESTSWDGRRSDGDLARRKESYTPLKLNEPLGHADPNPKIFPSLGSASESLHISHLHVVMFTFAISYHFPHQIQILFLISSFLFLFFWFNIHIKEEESLEAIYMYRIQHSVF